MKALGVPYKGSKARIAKKIIDSLPPAEYFVDLFAGGCAVTHAAMLSQKYKRFIVNDIDGRGADVFYRAAHGERASTEWVSRDEFHERKETDSFVAVIWSFGNDMNTYIYGAETESIKHAIHIAITEDDYTECKKLNIAVKPCTLPLNQLFERRISITTSIMEMGNAIPMRTKQLAQALERVERIEAIRQLQNTEALQRLEPIQRLDYSKVDIPSDSVVYCDIPYKDTNTGGYDVIDYEHFYDWCEHQKVPVFISEYSMPVERFKPHKSWQVHQTSSGKGKIKVATESLYVPQTHNDLPFGQLTLLDY